LGAGEMTWRNFVNFVLGLLLADWFVRNWIK